MVRVGKWKGAPSKDAVAVVETFLKNYFNTPIVWTRKEHRGVVVAVEETATNTEKVEEFRYNRVMSKKLNERFFFEETNENVEVTLSPL